MEDKYVTQAAAIKAAGFEVLIDRHPLTVRQLAELMKAVDGPDSLDKTEELAEGIWALVNEDD